MPKWWPHSASSIALNKPWCSGGHSNIEAWEWRVREAWECAVWHREQPWKAAQQCSALLGNRSPGEPLSNTLRLPGASGRAGDGGEHLTTKWIQGPVMRLKNTGFVVSGTQNTCGERPVFTHLQTWDSHPFMLVCFLQKTSSQHHLISTIFFKKKKKK